MTPAEKVACFRRPRPLKVEFIRPDIKDTYFTVNCDEKELGFTLSGVHVDRIEGFEDETPRPGKLVDVEPAPMPEGVHWKWALRVGLQLHDGRFRVPEQYFNKPSQIIPQNLNSII